MAVALAMSIVGALLVGAVHPSVVAALGDGSIDTTYGTNGVARFDEPNPLMDVLTLPDRATLVLHPTGYGEYVVSRLTPAGQLDTSFGQAGTASIVFGNAYGARMARQSDGKILILGRLLALSQSAIVRLLPNGALDLAFGNDGTVSFGTATNPMLAWDIAVGADDKIVVVGTTFPSPFAMRFLPNGTADATFGTAGYVTATAENVAAMQTTSVVINPDGSVVLGGQISLPSYSTGFALVRFSPLGVFDTTFGVAGLASATNGPNAGSEMHRLLRQPDGKLVGVGVVYETIGGTIPLEDFTLMRFGADGMADPTFNGDGHVRTALGGRSRAVNAAIQPDGSIIAVGSRVIGMVDDVIALVKYRSDGSIDTSFHGTGIVFNDAVRGASVMSQVADGSIIVGGTIGVMGTQFGIVRLEVSSPTALNIGAPRRVIDTRFASRPSAGSITRVTTATPPGSTAVLVNLTMANAVTPGYVTADRCSTLRAGPQTRSTGNFVPGRAVANTSVVPLDADGAFCVYSDQPVDVIVDVQGWFAPTGMKLLATTPARRLDTRAGPIRPAGSVTVVNAGAPSGTTAVLVNLTMTGPTTPGYVTADACSALRSGAQSKSNGNFAPGLDIANTSVVNLDTDGTFCIYNEQPVHLLADVQGVYSNVGLVTRVYTPTRISDTRAGGPLPAGTITRVPTDNPGAAAVLVNLTMTGATAAGFVTADRCSSLVAGPQSRSNGNYAPGIDVANAAIVALDTDGAFCIYNSAPVNVLVDAQGLL